MPALTGLDAVCGECHGAPAAWATTNDPFAEPHAPPPCQSLTFMTAGRRFCAAYLRGTEGRTYDPARGSDEAHGPQCPEDYANCGRHWHYQALKAGSTAQPTKPAARDAVPASSPTFPADSTRGTAMNTPGPTGSASSSASGSAGVAVLVVFLVLFCIIIAAAAGLWLASKNKGKARARAVVLATGSRAGDEVHGVQMVPMASNPLHRGAGSVRTGVRDSTAVRWGENHGGGAAMDGDDSHGSGHYGLFGGRGGSYRSGGVTTVRLAATPEGGNRCVSIQQRQGPTPDTIYAVPLADPAGGSPNSHHFYGPMPTLRCDAVPPAVAVSQGTQLMQL